ncbi:MAG TPA: tetratricopeptide repeat protein [Blastocatellia bacterium]|nr:tetratricopeptide repeat protein [Blastocatellia bacterium]
MMRRIALTLTALFCLAIVAPAGLAVAKDNWISVRSKNFFLIGNAGEKDIRQVAIKLEQFREAFGRLMPSVKFSSHTPTTVIVFKSDQAYMPYKPVVDNKVSKEVAGYFQPGEDVNYITVSIERRSDNSFRTIFHEYIHMLVNNTQADLEYPVWFDEGLAEYYSTVQIKDDQKVILGHLIFEHLELLRDNDLWPLQTIFKMDSHTLHRNDDDAQQFFYAQSWILFHYLFMGNEGRRQAQLDQFLRLLVSNVPLDDAFRKAFETDYATLEKELTQYLKRKTYMARSIEFNQKLEIDADMQTAPISEAEAQAYLGDLLLHTQRVDDAQTHLERALTLDPNLAMAHVALGRAHVRKKRFEPAKRHLQKAITLDPQNHLAHYYYAHAFSEESLGELRIVSGYSAEAAQAMRTALRKAIELRPSFAESYQLLAFVNLVMGDRTDESVDLIKKALAISPGNPEYSILLAEIYLHKMDLKAARAVAEPIANRASSEMARKRAESLLGSIKKAEERMAAEKERAASAAVKEYEAPKVENVSQEERFLGWIQQRLRKPADGEQRVQGMLVNIECAPKNVVYTIRLGERVIKLRSDSLVDVDMVSHKYNEELVMGCGPTKPESAVVIVYRPAADARRKIDGVAISFEFVPAKFQLKE